MPESEEMNETASAFPDAGVVQNRRSVPRHAVVKRERCTGCGLCGELCPTGAIRVTYRATIVVDRCTGCGICVEVCPLGAIHLMAQAPSPAEEQCNA
jgi:formate hydrogenlyase subunit 6/NADH:ubiquinone oxidoreductase subunit I